VPPADFHKLGVLIQKYIAATLPIWSAALSAPDEALIVGFSGAYHISNQRFLDHKGSVDGAAGKSIRSKLNCLFKTSPC
jgi:hypothetical protein